MKLNLKQKKILKLLSINCRFTNKDIAKSVGISEDSVAYQIDKLISKDKLAKFNIQFFHPMLGYDSYHIWIRLKKDNIEKMKEIDEVHSINISQGRFDYQLLVFAKNKKEFLEVLKKIKKIIQIQEIKFSKLEMISKSFSNIIPPIDINIKIPNNNRKFEYILNTEQYPLGDFSKKITLDIVDKKIIKALLKNPRASFQELAKMTEINHETIRYRMKKYVKEKIITNFGLIHDFQKYGLFVNYFLINVNKNELNEKKFLNYLNSKINIFYCARLKGDYDYIVYVASESPLELGEINNDLILALGDSIKDLDLLFMGKTIKYRQFPVKILE